MGCAQANEFHATFIQLLELYECLFNFVRNFVVAALVFGIQTLFRGPHFFIPKKYKREDIICTGIFYLNNTMNRIRVPLGGIFSFFLLLLFSSTLNSFVFMITA